MKTITAKFTLPDGTTLTAKAEFSFLPSFEPIDWTGNVSALHALFPIQMRAWAMPVMADAGNFTESMKHMGKLASVRVDIEETGEWEEIEGAL